MVLAAVVLVIAALYFARAVLLPLALAALLSFLLAPLARRLEAVGLRRVPSVVLVAVLSFSVIAAIGWLVAAQSADLAQKLPRYRRNIIAKVRTVRETLLQVNQASDAVEEIGKELTGATTQPADGAPGAATNGLDSTLAKSHSPLPEEAAADGAALPFDGRRNRRAPPGRNAPAGAVDTPPPDPQPEPEPVKVQVVAREQRVIPFLRGILGPLVAPLTQAGIVVVFVMLMLLQREDLRDRLIRLVGHRRIKVTTEALDEAASRVSRYLLMQLVLNGSHGAAVALGLTLIGVPNALLWGLLSALLRFIPYIGPWVAASLPVTLSLAVFDDWTRPMLVIALFIVIELISNNVLEPWLYGAQIGASPLAIVVSAVFWTWLWGGVGLVLATPMTVCLVVAGKYVPQLRFFDILLSNNPVLSPHVHLYQRLIANDRRGAQQTLDAMLADAPRAQAYDLLVMPALRHAERDRHRGILDEAHSARINALVRTLIDAQGPVEELRTPEDPAEPAAAPRKRCRVLCVPAHDAADELTAVLLAQLLQASGISAAAVSAELLAAERIRTVSVEQPDLVCICGLPPSTIAHLRYLYRRLRSAEPKMTVIVGLWGSAERCHAARKRLGDSGDITLANTLKRAHNLLVARARMLASRSGEHSTTTTVAG